MTFIQRCCRNSVLQTTFEFESVSGQPPRMGAGQKETWRAIVVLWAGQPRASPAVKRNKKLSSDLVWLEASFCDGGRFIWVRFLWPEGDGDRSQGRQLRLWINSNTRQYMIEEWLEFGKFLNLSSQILDKTSNLVKPLSGCTKNLDFLSNLSLMPHSQGWSWHLIWTKVQTKGSSGPICFWAIPFSVVRSAFRLYYSFVTPLNT